MTKGVNVLELEKNQLLARVAHLYYIEDTNQATIAKNLNIHRTTVSRMLKEARKKGIVEIQVNDFDAGLFELEAEAKEKFGLAYLEVVPSNPEDNAETIKEAIGLRASTLIRRLINDGDNVGLSWGSSLAATVKHVERKYTENTVFVPLVGGSTQVEASDHVNTLVYELSRKFQGQNIFVNASAIQETPGLSRGIINSQYFSELRGYWSNLDKAIVGIGGELGLEDSSWRDLLTEKDRKVLKEKEIIGDTCCRFFDKDGQVLKGNLYDRTIGISLEQLKSIPISIGVAAGEDKACAINALLKSSYINSLVTDESTLRKVLQFEAKNGKER